MYVFWWREKEGRGERFLLNFVESFGEKKIKEVFYFCLGD